MVPQPSLAPRFAAQIRQGFERTERLPRTLMLTVQESWLTRSLSLIFLRFAPRHGIVSCWLCNLKFPWTLNPTGSLFVRSDCDAAR